MLALMPIANFFIWFASTKIGRIVGLVALVLGSIALLWMKAKSAGRAEERDKNRKETDEFIEDKKKLDGDIAATPDAELDDRMRPWIRKGK